jgi:transcriptional regulator with XRE-family HTH domain
MDVDTVASEFLRQLRGRRSQTGFSRRLKYKSNIAYNWESGRCFPTAALAFQIAKEVGIDVEAAVRRFYVQPPPWLEEVSVTSRPGIARLLCDLKGNTRVSDLSRVSGKSRFAISRWLKGDAEPRLNEFFLLVECASMRLVDLIETFVDPRRMPSIQKRFESMTIARGLAYEAPWTQAVLRALELSDYQTRTAQSSAWIARRVGISVGEVERCLDLLHRAGQIRRVGRRWVPTEVVTLEVRRDPQQASRARGFWGHVAADRFADGHRGGMYTLCGVSNTDLERLRELQKAYFNEVRAIIAQSQPVERVVLSMVHVLDLAEERED